MATSSASATSGLPTSFLPALLDLLPSGVVYYTPLHDATGAVVDFHFAYLNPSAQRLLELPAQPTTTYLQQWPGSVASGAFALQRGAFLGTGPTQHTQLYQQAGTTIHVVAHACRVENGLLVSFISAADQPPALEQSLRAAQAREHERAQLRQAQAAVERERALLQALLAQAPVAIALFQGEELRVATTNQLMTNIWGHPLEQVLDQPLLEAVPELRGQGFDDLLRQVLTTRVPFTGTEVPATLLRDGQPQTTYYNFVYQPLYDAQGQVLGVIDVAVDVTEQVRARQQVQALNDELAVSNAALQQLNQELEARVRQRTRQLSEQQALLVQILQQVPAAIATVTGPEHRFTFCNELYQAQTGRRAHLGLAMAEALPEVVGLGHLALLDQVYATGQAYEGRELPFALPGPAASDQSVHYFNFVYQPLADAQGHTTGILIFGLNVTEQVLAKQLAQKSRQQVQDLNEELAVVNEELMATNEELHESNARLVRTNADLDTFVYTASHDLKLPITNIEGLLIALRETLPAEVQQTELVAELLRLLDNTVGRFRFTIAQLTDLVRLQQSQTGLVEPVDLAALLNEVCLDLATDIQAAGATVQAAIAPGIWVAFVPANLRSILYNLLSNAVKYRDPQRPALVQVRAARQPGAVVLAVQDNGLGLSESQQQRLFQVFQRLHTHVEGTGVGLYMIKRLIENGGGQITVSSELDVGSTFTVTFRT